MFERMNPAKPGSPLMRPRPLIGAAFVLLAIGALATVWVDATALCALPALALPLLMALRPYPGERVLIGMRECLALPRRRASRSCPRLARSEILLPRGGQLLGRALAVRPPPGALLGAA